MTSLEYNKHYRNSSYRRRRKLHLFHNPLCVRCQEKGISVPATVADHVVPHNGFVDLLLAGELQSLCESCHNSSKKYEEGRGYRQDVGLDGWPLDSRHPAYRARTAKDS
jgi:5-methylcytosine-specific restriction endonuclease McrA